MNARFAALFTVATAFACRTEVDSHVVPATMRMVDDDGKLQTIPIVLSERTIQYGWIPYRLAWRLDTHGNRIGGAIANGMSGTPVYGADGEFLGAVANSFGGPNCPGAIADGKFVLSTLEMGRSLTHQSETGPAIHEEVQPGTLVEVLYLWGDIDGGETGTVAYRSGNEVVLFGHKAFVYTNMGSHVFAIASVRRLAQLDVNQGSHIAGRINEVVGTVHCDGLGGTYGVLGETPPSWGLTIHLPSGRFPVRSFRMSKDPSRIADALRYALQESLKLASIGPDRRVLITAGLSGNNPGDPVSRMDFEGESMWEAVTKLVTELPQELTDVASIDLTVAPSQTP